MDSWSLHSKTSEDNRTQDLLELVGDREAVVRAVSTYSELHDLIASLSSKLSRVSSNVDKEFLASYRVHMLSIQSEIKTLKKDIVKGEQALNNDGTVAKLEKEVKWFSDECTRLKAHIAAMENDTVQLRSRSVALEEQQLFLTDQLKSVMKRNRVLQAEIDMASKQIGDQNIMAARSLAESSKIDHSQTLPPLTKTRSGSNASSLLFDSVPAASVPLLRSAHGMSATTGDAMEALGAPLRSGRASGGMRPSASTPNLTTGRDSRPRARTGSSEGLNEMARRQTTRSQSPPSMDAVAAVPYYAGDSRPLSPMRYLTAEQKQANEAHVLKSKNKKLLLELQQTISTTERNLGRAIVDVFEEIKDRKDEQRKRASRKRFDDNNNHKILERLMSSGKIPLHHNQQEKEEADHSLFLRSPSKYFVKSYESGVPKILERGGLGGLGMSEFSDNDKFAAVVKFLMDYTNFSNVVNGLKTLQS